jgi:hypothetical protein
MGSSELLPFSAKFAFKGDRCVGEEDQAEFVGVKSRSGSFRSFSER